MKIVGPSLQPGQVVERGDAGHDAATDVHIGRARVQNCELLVVLDDVEGTEGGVEGHLMIRFGRRGPLLRDELLERKRQARQVLRVTGQEDIDVVGVQRRAVDGGPEPADQHVRDAVRTQARKDAHRFEYLSHIPSSPRSVIGAWRGDP
ncbi:MAG: hypothetical protein ACRDH7_00520 [Actinomycetota bacterium]